MYRYFMSLKTPSGGFRMHDDGEVDTRGTYTVLAIARILNILTAELTEGVAEYLLSCQTYEGGFGGEPWNEAHGGYNFCAVAGLCILGRGLDCDLDALDCWLRERQMKLEGGFQGRTNKLVDACYSFWQAGAVVVAKMIRLGLPDDFDVQEAESAADIDAEDG
jgi:protein farnesyltransferase subunit beta